MNRSKEVDAWFEAKRRPAEAALQKVRTVILEADARMSEHVQYGNVQFAYQGTMASFVQAESKRVNLMFHRGGKIPGSYPHLEGEGRAVRFMRFDSEATVDERAAELAQIVRAWCDAMAPRRG